MNAFSLADIDVAAALEINFLLYVDLLPATYEGLEIGGDDRLLPDVSGNIILKRRRLLRNGMTEGFLDVAVDAAVGSVLVHVGEYGPPSSVYGGLEWLGIDALVAAVRAKRPELGDISDREPRIVMYSFPKLGLEYRANHGRSMLDLGSWVTVPPLDESIEGRLLGFWPFLENIDSAMRGRNEEKFRARNVFWKRIAEAAGIREPPTIVSKAFFEGLVQRLGLEVRKSCRRIGRSDCGVVNLRLQAQSEANWCVAASCFMVLDILGAATLSQSDIASSLGLGRVGGSTTLPPRGEDDVEQFLETLSGAKLSATVMRSPNYSQFVESVGAGRPVMSLIKGHCRTCVGTSSVQLSFDGETHAIQGVVTFDPWPEDGGRILHWESFDSYKYVSNIDVERLRPAPVAKRQAGRERSRP